MSLATGTADPPRPARRRTGALLVGVCLGAAFLTAMAGGLLTSGTPSRVGPPDQAAAGATATELARATRAQHLCYGWQLTDFQGGHSRPLSVGSNAGDGVSVRTAPGCDRWLEIIADVSASSKRNKVVLNLVDSRAAGKEVRLRIGSLGMTEQTFLADTGAAVLRAAGALPLIAAEEGLSQPVSAEPGARAAARPLPTVGSDFWRGRRDLLRVALPVSFLALASYVMLGVALRRRRRI
ncbi:hypothetical protein [Actinoplanes sp. NPDC049118]|uniref:hypothetical protein n=1 Tax=Actinoplanes sp. NPDC049118 TaxID=3155769 RepID=UPI0033ED6320